ncbi:disease resistance protein RPP13-like [Castanea sativa]|uniref:disease resistance protein RPP13-like n=1 Tax=Castanea sativa TaxID=21020 RepID=UPI003F651104
MDEDVHEVVSRLITNSENCSTHFIVGMKGIGKSTLAQMVFNHRAIQNHFESKYWVPLTDRADEEKNVLLKRLGQKVLPSPATNKEEGTNSDRKEKEYSIKELNEFLKGKKYLIVLDNLSSAEAWESLKAAFRDSTNGSRILITTRYKSVASNAESSHQLRLRTKDESWRKKNVTYEELLKVLNHIDHNQTPWTEIMDFDVKDLPLHLRQCLSYFGLFPKDSETSARRLVALWVAEGLVKPSGIEQEPPELVARKILKELMSLNLVQVVERRPNGKEKTCSFPSALRDLWLRSDASFDQRLAYNADEHDASSTLSHGLSVHFD